MLSGLRETRSPWREMARLWLLSNLHSCSSISILGVTIQNNCKFSLHVKAKLHELNKCLFIIRSLPKEGYTQARAN